MNSIQSDSNSLNDISPNEENLTETFQLLSSNDPKERINVVKRLTYLQKGVDEIAPLLVDKDAKVRETTAKSLGMVKPELITENTKNYLLTALEDPKDKVCSAAITTIGKLRIVEARERLNFFLEDKNPYIVSSAILSLAHLGQKDLGEKIIRFLESQNFYIQMSTVTALGNLNYFPAGSRLLEKLEEIIAQGIGKNDDLVRNYVLTLGKMNYSPAIPCLIEIAKNFVGARSKAINALIDMKAEEAVPILIPMLADPGVRIRDSLIRFMIKTDFSATKVLIRPLLNDRNAEIRSLVVSILSKEKNIQSLGPIKEIVINDSSPLVRIAAVNALSEWLGEDVTEILISLVKDQNSEIRRTVAEKLDRFANLTKEGIDAIQILANDEVEEIQILAKNILNRLNTIPLTLEKNKLVKSTHIVPNNIRKDNKILLKYLISWQEELPRLLNATNSAKISEVDNSLSKLIYYLEDSIKEGFD